MRGDIQLIILGIAVGFAVDVLNKYVVGNLVGGGA